MLLQKLRCFQFKNQASIELTFASQLNCLVGANGAGKTNLLDAIHYLCLTKSAFNPIDAQNIMHAQDQFAIQGHFVRADKDYEVQCLVRREQGKVVKVNGKPYDKLKEHVGRFPIVLTTPYDAELIQGKSEVRRKFFDNILCQIDSNYLNNLMQYQRILKQRNSCLKLYATTNRIDRTLIATYDQQLLPLARYIYEARKAFIGVFYPALQQQYDYFVQAPEAVELTYVSDVASLNFEQLYLDNLPQDLAAQRTTLGIHRDDFDFTLNGYSLKKIGSQGQQKSFIIALRLAQFAGIYQACQCKPLLLLDDIFDKLDEERIQRLIQLITQQHFGQVWLTDARGMRSMILMKEIKADKALFKIEKGALVANERLS
jgi:DNA replication and repair protein RecF